MRIWCTSRSVVGRGYCSDGLRSMWRRTLRNAWYLQVRECCGPGRGVCPRVGTRLKLCAGGRMAQIQGSVPVDGQRGLIHWLGQAEHGLSQVVARVILAGARAAAL